MERPGNVPSESLRFVSSGGSVTVRTMVRHRTPTPSRRGSVVENPPGSVRYQVPFVKAGLRVREGTDQLKRSVEATRVVEAGFAQIGDDNSHAHERLLDSHLCQSAPACAPEKYA